MSVKKFFDLPNKLLPNTDIGIVRQDQWFWAEGVWARGWHDQVLDIDCIVNTPQPPAIKFREMVSLTVHRSIQLQNNRGRLN